MLKFEKLDLCDGFDAASVMEDAKSGLAAFTVGSCVLKGIYNLVSVADNIMAEVGVSGPAISITNKEPADCSLTLTKEVTEVITMATNSADVELKHVIDKIISCSPAISTSANTDTYGPGHTKIQLAASASAGSKVTVKYMARVATGKGTDLEAPSAKHIVVADETHINALCRVVDSPNASRHNLTSCTIIPEGQLSI